MQLERLNKTVPNLKDNKSPSKATGEYDSQVLAPQGSSSNLNNSQKRNQNTDPSSSSLNFKK